MLENKTLQENWQFYHHHLAVPESGEIGYIENLESGKALTVIGDQYSRDTVILEDKIEEEDLVQMWKRGQTDENGFFKLKNLRNKSFLSVSSATETITGIFSAIIQRELNRWSQFSEPKLRYFSKVKI